MPEHKPWEHEPNELRWVDPATRLKCVILRIPTMGHLCGYVKLPRNSKWYPKGRGYRNPNFAVHGGVTFRGPLKRPTGGTFPGRWVGFDCAHHCDKSPFCKYFEYGEYRDLEYVKRQVQLLASQVRG